MECIGLIANIFAQTAAIDGKAQPKASHQATASPSEPNEILVATALM
jgi:hypothetical protein